MGFNPENLRPDSLRKRLSIIENATVMFIEMGYEKASMNLLVKRTGCSKSTLYRHFESKEALFIAVIDEEVKDHLKVIDELDIKEIPLEQGLSKIARVGLDVITSSEHINLCRIVYAEAERIPVIGQIYYEHGPRQGMRGVANYLRHMVKTGKIQCRDPQFAAEQFWAMLLHKPMLEHYCGLIKPTAPRLSNRYIRRIVREFIQAFIH